MPGASAGPEPLRAELFAFLTHVHKIRDQELFLDHSETLKHSQRRKYYRRRVQVSVEVATAEHPEEAVPALLADFSGGGASLQNPGLAVEQGALLELTFVPRGARFSVAGRVVRISSGGKILHLQFEGLGDAARDRVVGLVFGAKAPS